MNRKSQGAPACARNGNDACIVFLVPRRLVRLPHGRPRRCLTAEPLFSGCLTAVSAAASRREPLLSGPGPRPDMHLHSVCLPMTCLRSLHMLALPAILPFARVYSCMQYFLAFAWSFVFTRSFYSPIRHASSPYASLLTCTCHVSMGSQLDQHSLRRTPARLLCRAAVPGRHLSCV